MTFDREISTYPFQLPPYAAIFLVNQEVAMRLRESQKRSLTAGVEQSDDFAEESEVSALRRYQYNGLMDQERDDEDDDREYYI